MSLNSNDITLDLTASFVDVRNPTNFGTYDSDPQFQSDANGLVRMVYRRLGGNVIQVELTNVDVYSAFEQAMLEYSSLVNTYQAKSVLANLLGYVTGTLSGSENKVPRFDLNFAKRAAQGYGTEALVGGTRTMYSGSIPIQVGQQHYDLNGLLSSSGVLSGTQRAEIREILHFSPTAAYRFYDTTSAVNYLNNQFSFESFTPETIFYMLPIWEDVLRAQQLELNQRVRRSNYSFGVVNNMLTIYPVPTTATTLYFKYYLNGAADNFDQNDPFTNGVANLSNVPFGNIMYSNVNSIGKQWVKKMTLAFCKETLGLARRKVNEIPIANGNLMLDGAPLVEEGRAEQENLRLELKDWFESMTYQRLAQQQQEEADALQRVLQKVPNAIFVG